MDCGLLHENGQLGKLKKKIIQQAKHFHPVFNVNKLSQVVSELQVDSQYIQAEWHIKKTSSSPNLGVGSEIDNPAMRFLDTLLGSIMACQGPRGSKLDSHRKGWAMCIQTNIPEQMDGS